MKKKEDRRVRYTKALLKNALVELLRDKHISRISVSALCEAADVNRSTFYVHYDDQFDLLAQLQKEALDNIEDYISQQEFDETTPISLQKLIRILEYAKRDRDMILALLGDNGGAAFHQQIMQFVSQFRLTIHAGEEGRMNDYISLFSVSGCVSVLKRWLEKGTEEPVEEMAGLILKLTQYGNIGR